MVVTLNVTHKKISQVHYVPTCAAKYCAHSFLQHCLDNCRCLVSNPHPVYLYTTTVSQSASCPNLVWMSDAFLKQRCAITCALGSDTMLFYGSAARVRTPATQYSRRSCRFARVTPQVLETNIEILQKESIPRELIRWKINSQTNLPHLLCFKPSIWQG
jgi:hypothetical protein